MAESTRTGAKNKEEKLRQHYQLKKDEYLELCWRYGLPPRDLNLLLMGRREIAAPDRIRLIRLIVKLVDLEKILGPDKISDLIFPVDDSHYFNSAIFPVNLH